MSTALQNRKAEEAARRKAMAADKRAEFLELLAIRKAERAAEKDEERERLRVRCRHVPPPPPSASPLLTLCVSACPAVVARRRRTNRR